MPIRGLTERTRLPRLGKIRLGEKATSARSGKEYPVALDHFNFRDVPELEAVFGQACKEIYPIYIPLEVEDEWFVTSLVAYTKSSKFCQCMDTETATRVFVGLDERGQPRDPQGFAFLQSTRPDDLPEVGTMFDLPCPAQECIYYKRDLCGQLGRLLFLVEASPRFGVYEIATSSTNSILNVLSKARAIKAAAGRITGIPLALQLRPMEVQPDGKKKTVFVLDLDFRDAKSAVRRLIAIGRNPIGMIAGGVEPGPETVPDDLYPRGGAVLEREVGLIEVGTEAPAPEEPMLNHPDDVFGPEPPAKEEAPAPAAPAARAKAAPRKAPVPAAAPPAGQPALPDLDF